MMLKYFVSYVYTNKLATGVGNADITREEPISGIADIRELEKQLAEQYEYESVVFCSYQLF